jgi:hypothetical protein
MLLSIVQTSIEFLKSIAVRLATLKHPFSLQASIIQSITLILLVKIQPTAMPNLLPYFIRKDLVLLLTNHLDLADLIMVANRRDRSIESNLQIFLM